ncbi:Toxic cation resistance protein, partial [Streptomyces sp. NPDC005728]
MGILTLLRNAFGRSRKGRTAEAEGADRSLSDSSPTAPPEASPQVPEPRTSSPETHDLVSAAFDQVSVPRQATEPTPNTPAEATEVAT